ncbi:DUF6461 domain-containing protein [Herbidospora cretacea]|uniref:DUF6461 domain-containing protein n=1 Tax=Herbidospora cretacea TaxID=28444 RepID=UPI000774C4ED|nr:histone-like nucleoid-structuring protein Lsr2 [Herbidospora cretacea]
MSDHEVSPLRVSRVLFSGELSRRVREWAKAEGLPVSHRGRIATQIVDAFFAAHPEALAGADRLELVRAVAHDPEDGRATPQDYAWQDRPGPLDPIYTLTFVHGLTENEVLRRFGVAPQDVRPFTEEDVYENLEQTNGLGDVVLVAGLGEWAVAVELRGWQGTDPDLLRALSRDGGQAIAVGRHDYAHDQFSYAVDGRLVTSFDPAFPHQRQGTDPDRLNRHLRDLGIDPSAGDQIENALPAALALASRISGVVLHPARLREPLPGGRITSHDRT